MDDFEVRSAVRYLLGQGFPPYCNTGMKHKITRLAGWHTVIDGVVYRDSGFQPDIGLSVMAKDSRTADISWVVHHYKSFPSSCNVEIRVYTLQNNAEVSFTKKRYEVGCSTVTGLQAGQEYVISVRFVRYLQLNKPYQYVIAQAHRQHRSVLGKSELALLFHRAREFVKDDPGHDMYVFYRNKPHDYFEEIFQNGGVMYPYMKDFNGDQGCPINGRIKGLFFGGKTEYDGSLPTRSPFGDTRFVIPADRLFHERMNLYFADFYCHTVIHYVTVVLAERFSDTDRFCQEYLLPLSPTNNPFLTVSLFGPNRIAKRVYVEVFYTLPVNLRQELAQDHRCQMGNTLIIGRGSSKVEGIVKNPNCNVCNLYRSKRKREVSEVKQEVKKEVKQEVDKNPRPTLKAKRKNISNSQPSAAKSVSDTKLSVKSESTLKKTASPPVKPESVVKETAIEQSKRVKVDTTSTTSSTVGHSNGPELMKKSTSPATKNDHNSNIVKRVPTSPAKDVKNTSPTSSDGPATKEDSHTLTSLPQKPATSADGKTKEDSCSIGKSDTDDSVEILPTPSPLVIDLTHDDDTDDLDPKRPVDTSHSRKGLTESKSQQGKSSINPEQKVNVETNSNEGKNNKTIDQENQNQVDLTPEPPKCKRFKVDQ